MTDIEYQAKYFISEILILLDEGKSITIQKFEEEMDEGNIIEFIGKNYGFKNQNSIPENQDKLKVALADMYVSESEGRNKRITNNGLVYLLDCLINIIANELFDYKMNYLNEMEEE